MNKKIYIRLLLLTVIILNFYYGCSRHSQNMVEMEQWQEIELNFTSENQYQNPYTDVEFWVEFTGPNGENLSRPGFWFEKNIWQVRFASPTDAGQWHWKSFANDTTDLGLNGRQGTLISKPYKGKNPLIKNGLLRMSPGRRNVIHANGKLFLMIGDTPWALPWRGTVKTVTEYAQKRQSQGFNTALLMSLQPDCEAKGPRNRTERDAFDVAFEDLKDGHINQLNPFYFQYVDSLRNILVEHGIVPVFQPVFHGFGWKGQKVLGWDMDAKEYARYCRYLVARYGAQPAMWLVGADSDGRNKGIKEGGEEIEKWDAYQQPAGIHYSPFDDYTPDFLKDFGGKYEPHMNRTFQEADWLDFQWCQTGHSGKHLFHKVALMHDNKPVKASCNAEPTYEGISDSLNGSGWWQGHEAWSQFCSGGTMGVIYGAGGLWNWKLYKDEQWPEWADSKVSWQEAIQLPGANFVGYLGKALEGLDITDIERHPELADGQLCLAKPGKLYIIYLPEGGKVKIAGLSDQMQYRWFDPVKGNFEVDGVVQASKNNFIADGKNPQVLIIKEK
ncbi:MAG TPA: DUF4038 domain-containing protein [bacterium]|nr:DUF4038 domain-containing protein [bacterium]HPN45566.1 DUF4038 domain-containing protein [bacterium]